MKHKNKNKTNELESHEFLRDYSSNDELPIILPSDTDLHDEYPAMSFVEFINRRFAQVL